MIRQSIMFNLLKDIINKHLEFNNCITNKCMYAGCGWNEKDINVDRIIALVGQQ